MKQTNEWKRFMNNTILSFMWAQSLWHSCVISLDIFRILHIPFAREIYSSLSNQQQAFQNSTKITFLVFIYFVFLFFFFLYGINMKLLFLGIILFILSWEKRCTISNEICKNAFKIDQTNWIFAVIMETILFFFLVSKIFGIKPLKFRCILKTAWFNLWLCYPVPSYMWLNLYAHNKATGNSNSCLFQFHKNKKQKYKKKIVKRERESHTKTREKKLSALFHQPSQH